MAPPFPNGRATPGPPPPLTVVIREVGPRDGLQVEAPVPVAGRVALVEALVAAGLVDIEVAAFVSAAAVPAMAGAAEVLAGLERRPGVRYWALVPNLVGAQAALDGGVDGLTMTVSASAAYNLRNVKMSVEASVAETAAVCRRAGGAVPVDVVVSCAFGSPAEGPADPAQVAALGHRLVDAGASSLTLADTTGGATPGQVEALLTLTGTGVGLHLHDSGGPPGRRAGERGTALGGPALVNAYAAWQMGLSRFDTSIGGLGGSPFSGAPPAGNLATESLVHLLADAGVTTGIDLDRLAGAASLAGSLIGRPLLTARSGHGLV